MLCRKRCPISIFFNENRLTCLSSTLLNRRRKWGLRRYTFTKKASFHFRIFLSPNYSVPQKLLLAPSINLQVYNENIIVRQVGIVWMGIFNGCFQYQESWQFFHIFSMFKTPLNFHKYLNCILAKLIQPFWSFGQTNAQQLIFVYTYVQKMIVI